MKLRVIDYMCLTLRLTEQQRVNLLVPLSAVRGQLTLVHNGRVLTNLLNYLQRQACWATQHSVLLCGYQDRVCSALCSEHMLFKNFMWVKSVSLNKNITY